MNPFAESHSTRRVLTLTQNHTPRRPRAPTTAATMRADALYFSKRGSFTFVLGLFASALFRRINRLRDSHRSPPARLRVTSHKRPDAPPIAVRRLRAGDDRRGFRALLAQLTEVGEGDFKRRFRAIQDGPEYVYVIESESGDRVVASGTLVLERKFTRGCGTCGHIEDVVVDANERGKDLGRVMIEALTKAAEVCGCYKVILDCSEKNAGFYERCGYSRKEIQMAKYFV